MFAGMSHEAFVRDSIHFIPTLDAVAATAQGVWRFRGSTKDIGGFSQCQHHSIQFGLELLKDFTRRGGSVVGHFNLRLDAIALEMVIPRWLWILLVAFDDELRHPKQGAFVFGVGKALDG